MEQVAVIGAGTIGSGVAQSFAMYGYDVFLYDINQEKLEAVKNDISRNLRFMQMMKKMPVQDDIATIVDRIHLCKSFDELSDCTFYIENIVEKFEEKKKVYEQLKAFHNDTKIYLVNTSCILIEKIADILDQSGNVIGVHFMNPVPMKDTVEVIISKYTTSECQQKVLDLLKSVGKGAAIVNDSPGFVSNRLSHLFMNEAAMIVQEGVATVETVDTIFKKCFGHAMGPLETADLIGIDTVVDSLDVLEESYQEDKFKACDLLRQKVSEGKLGRKSLEGFYKYN